MSVEFYEMTLGTTVDGSDRPDNRDRRVRVVEGRGIVHFSIEDARDSSNGQSVVMTRKEFAAFYEAMSGLARRLSVTP